MSDSTEPEILAATDALAACRGRLGWLCEELVKCVHEEPLQAGRLFGIKVYASHLHDEAVKIGELRATLDRLRNDEGSGT